MLQLERFGSSFQNRRRQNHIVIVDCDGGNIRHIEHTANVDILSTNINCCGSELQQDEGDEGCEEEGGNEARD